MAFCRGIPQWHSLDDVRAALMRFSHKNAREPDSSAAKKDLIRRLKIIGSYLQEQGLSFKGFEYVGSTWEHLKISNGYEFDVLVVLGGRGFTAVPTSDPQYSMIKPNPGLQPPNLNPRMMKNGVVTAEQVSRIFQSLLDKLAAKHPEFSRENVVFRKNGPAIMMDVTYRGLRYSADLVPTYRIKDNYYVAKPRKSQPDAWLHSYSRDVKKALDGLDRDNGCRKQVGRILKAICHKDSSLRKISSHHLKMALLTELKEHPEKSWQQKDLVPRVQDVMRRMGNYVEEGNFPHHFMPDVNLVKPLNADMRCRMVRLYNKKGVFLKAIDEKPEMKTSTTATPAAERAVVVGANEATTVDVRPKAATPAAERVVVLGATAATTVDVGPKAATTIVAGAKTAMAEVHEAKAAIRAAERAVVVGAMAATTVDVGPNAAATVAAGAKAATAQVQDVDTTMTDEEHAQQATTEVEEATNTPTQTKKKRYRRQNSRRRRKCAQQKESFSWGGGF